MPKHMPVLVLTGIGLASAFAASVFLLLWASVMPRYPGAIRKSGCGSYAAYPYAISLIQCFESSDDLQEVTDWYRRAGWYRFGDPVVSQRVRLGQVCLEIGKEFVAGPAAVGVWTSQPVINAYETRIL
jgi:hypothetical protein